MKYRKEQENGCSFLAHCVYYSDLDLLPPVHSYKDNDKELYNIDCTWTNHSREIRVVTTVRRHR